MQQSNFIFAMLLIAFLVFITARGELKDYLSLFRGEGSSATSQNKSSENSILSGAQQFLNNALSPSSLIDTSAPSHYDLSTNEGASRAILDIFDSH